MSRRPRQPCQIVGARNVPRSLLRHAEVEHLHPPGIRHHHVRRFDIAVDEPEPVRFGQRIGNLFPDVEHLIEIDRTAPDERRHGGALDVLHRDVRNRPPVEFRFAGLVHDGNVGMIQGRRGARFVEQPSRAFLARRIRSKHLECDDAAEQQILRSVHVAHASRAERFEDTIVRERRTDHVESRLN